MHQSLTMIMRKRLLLTGAALLALVSVTPFAGAADQAAKAGAKNPAASRSMLERGKYLLYVGNCNDCHTDGYAESDGKVPEKDWLLGGRTLGFSGPWGTTYAPNLRLTLSKLSESQWVKFAKELRARPPMPWYNVNHWSEPDLRAFYRYVRSLGPVGSPAPEYLPPDKPAPPPVLLWPSPPKK